LTGAELDEVMNFTTFNFKSTDLKDEMLKGVILLDNQAQSSIFGRDDILTDIQPKDSPSSYKGIGGSFITANHQGTFLRHLKIDTSPLSSANIISWSQAIKAGAHIEYDADADHFVMDLGGKRLVFVPYNNLYAYQIPSANQVYLNKRNIEEVDLAAEIQRRLAFPAKSGLEHVIRSGAIHNMPIGTTAVRIMPESIPHLQGKSPKRNQSLAPVIRTFRENEHCSLYADICYITPNSDRLDFLVATTDFNATFIRPIKNRGTAQVGHALVEIFSQLKKYFWKVHEVWSDNEGGIKEAV
jgi:hypothetical protein